VHTTDILYRTVSELSQLIVQILDTLRFWATLWGLRDNVRCSSCAHWKARSGLPITVNWTFFAKCFAEELREKIDRKSAISLLRGQFDSKFQVEGVAPPIILCTDSYANECLITLSLTFFTQRNFAAYFFQAKCDFRRKTAVLRFSDPLWGLRSNVRWSS